MPSTPLDSHSSQHWTVAAPGELDADSMPHAMMHKHACYQDPRKHRSAWRPGERRGERHAESPHRPELASWSCSSAGIVGRCWVRDQEAPPDQTSTRCSTPTCTSTLAVSTLHPAQPQARKGKLPAEARSSMSQARARRAH